MYKLLLCLRYLRTKYIALASIISVMLGVATMIVVNSVMAGFSNEMRDRIHGFLADIVVEARSMDGIEDSEKQLAIVNEAAGEYIEAMTRTVEVPAMTTFTDPITRESYTTDIMLVGIDAEGKAKVGPLRSYLDSYNPVMEGGQVVREPLRASDAPLGWDLTEPAKQYRELMKQEEMLYLQNQQFMSGGFNEPATAAPVEEFAPAEDFEAVSETESSTPDSDDSSEQPEIFDPSAIADESTSPTIDPFLNQSPVTPDGPQTGPLPARVYLGEGIVSFLAQDPRTGETRKHYMVNPGDDIILTTMLAGTPPKPVSFSATVTDMFRSGMSEYDSKLVLMNIDELQKNRGMIVQGVDAITSIQIKLKNYEDADEVVRRLEAAFPPGAVTVKTWEEKQGLLLSAVEMETAILNVLLFLIIAVAGFGILAIFFMIVVEKTRDIGILKSLGASSGGVMSIFLSYGLGLGIVGSAAGVTIGLLFVRYINQIEDGLSWLTGRKVFDEKIYYFFEIPTQVNPMMVFWVAIGAIAIAVMASVLPARRASRLHPVRALRYE